MAGKTHWLEQQVLNHIFRTTGLTQPTSLWLALFTAAPNDDYTSGVPTGTECSGNAYARQTVGTLDADWTFTAGSGATPAKVHNTNAITWSVNPSGSWGLVTHAGLVDAASGAANLWYWGAVTVQQTPTAGNVVSFPATTLVFNED